MTAVVMVIFAAAVAAWVLAPLRNATNSIHLRARGGARDATARQQAGGAGPGDTIERTPGGER
ncbi:MAG TPA: hypothetical protein VFP86_00440 [bacterium]|nr:hypothetical protein [bacterium]